MGEPLGDKQLWRLGEYGEVENKNAKQRAQISLAKNGQEHTYG